MRLNGIKYGIYLNANGDAAPTPTRAKNNIFLICFNLNGMAMN